MHSCGIKISFKLHLVGCKSTISSQVVAHQKIEVDNLKIVKNKNSALKKKGLARVYKITMVQGWIFGKVTRQRSKVLCQMVEAVIRSDQNIMAWDGGTQG